MARPRKNNADYFSHDNDMRNDDKILAVRRKFGHEGYSIWNMLLEKLCKSDGFIIDVDNVSLELLSGDFMIDPDKLSIMIDYFYSIRLLCKTGDKIYSQKMIDRFNGLLSKRKRDIDYRERKQDDEVVIDVEKPQSKVKESKVNKTKEEKSDNTNIDPIGSPDLDFTDEDKNGIDYCNPKVLVNNTPPVPPAPPKLYEPTEITNSINELIETIKTQCKESGIIYSADSKERIYAKHILGKKFKSDCLDQVDMELMDFIRNVIYLSSKVKYSKTLSSAKSIYYNRADVVNKAKQQQLQSPQKRVFSY